MEPFLRRLLVRTLAGDKIAGTHHKLGCPPLPLEQCLDNTRFGATNERVLHPVYILYRGVFPKALAQKLSSRPYITLKIWYFQGARY